MTAERQPSTRRRSGEDHDGEVPFEPINQLRAHEYVAEQIRRHIALRLIEPGDALPSERELAAMFGVGRPTVQHAMRILEADHLVSAHRGRYGGTFVLEPGEDEALMEELMTRILRKRAEVEELLVYRRTLEPEVAGLAAVTRRKRDLAALRKADRGMNDPPTEAAYMRHDTEFHVTIARATRNRFIVRQIEDIRSRLNDAISLLPESDRWHQQIAQEHHAIIHGIEAGDRASARETMGRHVATSEQSVRAALAAIRRRLAS